MADQDKTPLSDDDLEGAVGGTKKSPPPPPPPPPNNFLDGIAGESLDKGHSDEIR
jgi:hypothetical protein